MGYGTRGKEIRTFWPDDTETKLHLNSEEFRSLADLLEKVNQKWPGVPSERIEISSQKIHTDCLGYDLYDSGDYTDFIILTLREGL